jgi:hypothetical protein
MRFKHIGYKGGSLNLRWEVKIGEVTGSYGIEGKNEPSASFRDALAALTGVALQILDIPRNVQNFKATGVHFSEDKNGVRGAVITTIKMCKAAKVGVAINTPYLAERSETQKEAQGFYIDGMEEALRELEAEANLYFKGLERQGNLFDQTLGVMLPDDDDEEHAPDVTDEGLSELRESAAAGR